MDSIIPKQAEVLREYLATMGVVLDQHHAEEALEKLHARSWDNMIEQATKAQRKAHEKKPTEKQVNSTLDDEEKLRLHLMAESVKEIASEANKVYCSVKDASTIRFGTGATRAACQVAVSFAERNHDRKFTKEALYMQSQLSTVKDMPCNNGLQGNIQRIERKLVENEILRSSIDPFILHGAAAAMVLADQDPDAFFLVFGPAIVIRAEQSFQDLDDEITGVMPPRKLEQETDDDQNDIEKNLEDLLGKQHGVAIS